MPPEGNSTENYPVVIRSKLSNIKYMRGIPPNSEENLPHAAFHILVEFFGFVGLGFFL